MHRSGAGYIAIVRHCWRIGVLAVLAICARPSQAFQSASSVTLTSSINPGIAQQSVTFTATVAGSPTPTGSVVFSDSGTALYSPVQLNANGSAMFTTSSLSAATHSITAAYSGDSNYSPSTSPALNEVIVPAASSDYDFTSNLTTQSVVAGSSVNFTLTVTPTNGYNGTVTFSCAGLAVGVTCSFAPESVTPNNTNNAITSVLTVATTGTKTSALLSSPTRDRHPGKLRKGDNILGMFAIVLGIFGSRGVRRSRLKAIGAFTALALLVFLSGCGGNGSTSTTPTPAGTQTFTVDGTGTAGTNGGNTAAHQLSLMITVTSS